MGNDEISKKCQEKLQQNLNEFGAISYRVLDSYTRNLQLYIDSMQKSLNQIDYFREVDFIRLHQNTKNQAIAQFQSQSGDNELKSDVQKKLESKIDQKLPAFKATNEAKRQCFIVSIGV